VVLGTASVIGTSVEGTCTRRESMAERYRSELRAESTMDRRTERRSNVRLRSDRGVERRTASRAERRDKRKALRNPVSRATRQPRRGKFIVT
jgi:hypothetical protein